MQGIYNCIGYLNQYTFNLHPACLSNPNVVLYSKTQLLFISFFDLTNSLVTSQLSSERFIPAFICETNPFLFSLFP